jgi:hypothetical protein
MRVLGIGTDGDGVLGKSESPLVWLIFLKASCEVPFAEIAVLSLCPFGED